MSSWTAEQLRAVHAAHELEIASRREDGSWRKFVPIWTVVVGEDVFVRTWYRRETGWYGRVVRAGRARIRVPGVESDVAVAGVGTASRAEVDAAYRSKYEGGAGRMVADEAAATTLRLRPA